MTRPTGLARMNGHPGARFVVVKPAGFHAVATADFSPEATDFSLEHAGPVS